MHKLPSRNQDLTDSVDKFLDEYKEKPKLGENQKGTYSKENRDLKNEETDPFNCEFKDTCHTYRFKTGECPCELVR